MKTEDEIKTALIQVLNGGMSHPFGSGIIAIRILAWVLDIEVKHCTRRRLKRVKQPVEIDHFAV